VRYDAGWGNRPPRRPPYDQGFREQPRDSGWNRPAAQPIPWAYRPWYDEDFTDRSDGIMHGPARYGLGPYHDRLRRRRRSDEELRSDVEEALFYDTWIDSDAITVEVSEGVVTLRGELPSYDEIRFATDDAWDVEGVLGVRTELRVAQG
jgi:hypothetical protein